PTLTRGPTQVSSIIVHADKEQSVRRRGCARVRAPAAIDQLRHRFGGSPPASDFDKRADDGPHHVPEKAIGSHFVHERLPTPWPALAVPWIRRARGGHP